MVVDGDVVDAFGDFEFFLARLRHAVLIDGQHDDRCVVVFCQLENLIGFIATGFEMSRVNETTSGCGLQCNFKNIEFGGVNHKRNVHAHFELLDDLAHELHFVGAFGDGAGNVEGVRAVLDLFTGDLQNGVVILLEQEPLELARALGVESLAKQGGGRILSHGDR